MSAPHLGLRNPDLTTAMRIAAAVNRDMGAPLAKATDPRTVALNLQGRDVVEALSQIQMLPIEPDTGAKVVIDEASGIIVMGANVVISTVAIAQGNLTIRVTGDSAGQPTRSVFKWNDPGGSPHQYHGGRRQPETAWYLEEGRDTTGTGAQHERIGRRPARHHQYSAGDQSRRCAAG